MHAITNVSHVLLGSLLFSRLFARVSSRALLARDHFRDITTSWLDQRRTKGSATPDHLGYSYLAISDWRQDSPTLAGHYCIDFPGVLCRLLATTDGGFIFFLIFLRFLLFSWPSHGVLAANSLLHLDKAVRIHFMA